MKVEIEYEIQEELTKAFDIQYFCILNKIECKIYPSLKNKGC